MHMSDALVSTAVGGVMCAASVACGAYSIAKIKKDELAEQKLPLIGVAGALVFAGQMINFTIPATGSSGHIGGGILLAGLLGGFPAFLAIAAVLIIQCLFFADGGLLALGANIFNMGAIPCLLIYPLLFKPLLSKGVTSGRLSVAAIVSVVIGLEIGALSVVLETLASGITTLPFGTFVALMLPIHLAIGVVEGIVTAAVLVFVWKMRPEIIDAARDRVQIASGVNTKRIFAMLAVLAVVVGAALSLFASSHPDGLEWSIGSIFDKEDVETGLGAFEEAGTGSAGVSDAVLERTAFLPDYAFASNPDNAVGTSVSGIVGSVSVFALAAVVAVVIGAVKKRKVIER